MDLRIEAIAQQAVYDRKNTEEAKNDSPAIVQRLEQRKEWIAGQLQRIQQNNKGGKAGQNREENLQKQMENIDKQIQTLTQQEGVKASEPTEEAKPSPNQLDEFVKSGERASKETAGIYRLGKDSAGNPKILIDQPEQEKADVAAAGSGTDAEPADVPEGGDKAAAASDKEDVQDTPPADQGDKDDKKQDDSPSDEGNEVITTINTDQVDAEIQKIREEKQQIEQEMRRAAGDDTKSAKLEQRLEFIESELKMKDNDNYRRQQAQVTVTAKK
ncbi:MAG: hypothetical protein ABFD66_05605 [Smithella sp.]